MSFGSFVGIIIIQIVTNQNESNISVKTVKALLLLSVIPQHFQPKKKGLFMGFGPEFPGIVGVNIGQRIRGEKERPIFFNQVSQKIPRDLCLTANGKCVRT